MKIAKFEKKEVAENCSSSSDLENSVKEIRKVREDINKCWKYMYLRMLTVFFEEEILVNGPGKHPEGLYFSGVVNRYLNGSF